MKTILFDTDSGKVISQIFPDGYLVDDQPQPVHHFQTLTQPTMLFYIFQQHLQVIQQHHVRQLQYLVQ